MPEKKIFVEVGKDRRPRMSHASFIPERPAREYRSENEKQVVELLEWKHPVPRAKWMKIGQKEKQMLREIAKTKEHPYRAKAITALVLSNDETHVEFLGEIIADKKEDKLVRSVAAISLGRSSSRHAGSTLLRFIGDEEEFVRAKIAEALGRVGGRESLPALHQLAKDKSALVHSNAKTALKLIELRVEESSKNA